MAVIRGSGETRTAIHKAIQKKTQVKPKTNTNTTNTNTSTNNTAGAGSTSNQSSSSQSLNSNTNQASNSSSSTHSTTVAYLQHYGMEVFVILPKEAVAEVFRVFRSDVQQSFIFIDSIS